ncbi:MULTISPECIES: sulfatase-like hydrolase/transferase [unclassified Yoonia]|uniref:sulfatase-like hydrolase/transferase n=1 Tax=unclassified Yoonia TaxID=2629118 RepID=UPI002B003084|nr:MULTISPECIES: sulfatase-like hydrolase/transferase [unclassified Yoonia]
MTKPNVLLVSFDDAVAYWPYKTAFNEPLLTPHLDRICAVSTAFHAAYSPATVCNPARASFMSGRSTHQLGVFSNQDNVFDKHDPRIMWPYRLKQDGYFCSSGGKVHHGHAPLPQPVHDILYSDAQKDFTYAISKPVRTTHFGGYKNGAATLDPADDDVFYDMRSAESAITFLTGYDGDAPFYREVGFHSPHSPFTTPARFKEMYRLSRFREPADWAGGYDSNAYADRAFPPRKELVNGRSRWWKQSLRNYFSAYSLVDDQLGRVWDALKASRHAQNTIVIVLADHGFHLGNKDRLQKSTLWEQVANVPLIIHLPGQTEAQVITDPVSMIDIGPTVLDYLGLGEIAGTVGQSLRPYLERRGVTPRAIPTFFYNNAAIRQGDYRIIRYDDATTQLYNLREDYWQLHDLGEGHPAYAALYASLVVTARLWGLQVEGGTFPQAQ